MERTKFPIRGQNKKNPFENLKHDSDKHIVELVKVTESFRKQIKSPSFHSHMFDGMLEEVHCMFETWDDWCKYRDRYENEWQDIFDKIRDAIKSYPRKGYTNDVDYIEVLVDDTEKQEELIKNGYHETSLDEFIETVQDIDY